MCSNTLGKPHSDPPLDGNFSFISQYRSIGQHNSEFAKKSAAGIEAKFHMKQSITIGAINIPYSSIYRYQNPERIG